MPRLPVPAALLHIITPQRQNIECHHYEGKRPRRVWCTLLAGPRTSRIGKNPHENKISSLRSAIIAAFGRFVASARGRGRDLVIHQKLQSKEKFFKKKKRGGGVALKLEVRALA